MENILSKNLILKNVLIDLGALALVYLIPASVHFTGLPVYMIEPMRLMLVISFVHGSRANSFLLACSLPFFSYLVSGHPELVKMLIITGELALNTALFYWLVKRYGSPFTALLLSVVISKIACYLAYWPVFSFGFMVEEAGMTFLIAQAVTTLLFSLYVFLSYKPRES